MRVPNFENQFEPRGEDNERDASHSPDSWNRDIRPETRSHTRSLRPRERGCKIDESLVDFQSIAPFLILIFLIASLYLEARGLKRRSCETKCGSLINRVLGRSSFPSPHALKSHDVDVDLRLCLFLIK